jgi:3-deoxy-7-phosphoheptulonate synthase
MVECHDCPSKAMCDGPQALLPASFAELMKELRGIAAVLGKKFVETPAAKNGK